MIHDEVGDDLLTFQSKKRRIIFHIDMNCFYASVEMSYQPELKGKAIAIAGNPEERKGIIITSSYEARSKGVKTTMPIWQAKKCCPELIILRPNFERYREASKAMFQILSEITPIIEPISIDEGYMDITNVENRGTPIEIAEFVQNRIMEKLDLPCSIGIAPNKFLAKMASDMKKPMGITVLRKRELHHTLWTLSVNEMYGVGEKTAEKLKQIGVHTIKDLAEHNEYELTRLLGVNGKRLKDRANGIDLREVDPESIHDRKSIGNSKTLPADVTDEHQIHGLLLQLAQNVEQRLKRKNMLGITIQIMVRYDDWITITRSKKLSSYTDNHSDIFKVAWDLFQQHWNGGAVRLLGVTMQDIAEKESIAQQLDIFTFEEEEKRANLQDTVNKLNEKYGKSTVSFLPEEKKKANFTTSFQKDYLDDYMKS